MDIQELTIEEQIGQLWICGTQKSGSQPDLEELIKHYKIGGIILFKKNYTSYEDMLHYIHQLHEWNKGNKVPLWIGIDQEGGRCNRMPPNFLNLYSAGKLAQTNDIDLIRRAAAVTGKMLKQTGITINFSPVLDVQRFPDNHAIGNRCYGITPQEVIANTIPVIEELKKKGILSIAKHFPGHGLVSSDSHFTLPVIEQPFSTIEQEDMAPFRAAMKHGVDGLMLGHLRIPSMDTQYPASLSHKIVEDYIRTTCDYKGLLVTDDFHMLPIRLGYGSVQAGRLAFMAGNDILLSHASKTSIVKTIQGIQDIVTHSDTWMESLQTRVLRILSFKEKYGVSGLLAPGTDIQEVNHEIASINSVVEQKLQLPILKA